MNEIVKYNNIMNEMQFFKFTAMDYNFLMGLCSKLKEKGDSEIILSFQEIKDIVSYDSKNTTARFICDLDRMNVKLMNVTCKLDTEDELIRFVLFPTFVIKKSAELLKVSVNPQFSFVLNELTRNFTRFELAEFIELDSKYSKSLYRLLKQFRTTGIYKVSIDDFRKKMDVPEKYTNNRVMDKIINPSLEEIKKYFVGLECVPKYSRKRGSPLEGFEFTWQAEARKKPELPDQSQKKEQKKPKKQNKWVANAGNREHDANYFTDIERVHAKKGEE